MSFFRRLLLEQDKGLWKATLTLYFKDDNTQYVASSQSDGGTRYDGVIENNDFWSEDYGVGFYLSIPSLAATIDMVSVKFIENNTGRELIPFGPYHHTTVTGISCEYWISKHFQNISAGYYTVEITVDPSSESVFDVVECNINDMNDIPVGGPPASSKDTREYGYCYCLSSVDSLEPDYATEGKGFKVSMTKI